MILVPYHRCVVDFFYFHHGGISVENNFAWFHGWIKRFYPSARYWTSLLNTHRHTIQEVWWCIQWSYCLCYVYTWMHGNAAYWYIFPVAYISGIKANIDYVSMSHGLALCVFNTNIIQSNYVLFIKHIWTLTTTDFYRMRDWIRSSLFQVMDCSLFSSKPLSEPLSTYRQLDDMNARASGKLK